MQIWHLPENLETFYRPKGELAYLVWANALRKVAVIFLVLFSPIYIFQILRDFGLSFRFSLFFVLFFYIIEQVSRALTFLFSEEWSKRIGFKGIIRASFLPFVLFILCLIFAKTYILLLIPAAIFVGIQSAFYWWGYHGYFIKSGDAKHFALSISEAGLLETFAAVGSPIVGALVIRNFGFESLFILVGIFMLSGLTLLGKDHDKRQRRDVTVKEVVELIKSHKAMSLAYIGSSGEAVIYTVAWPLFLFLFFGQVVSLGAIISLAALVAAVFAIAIGNWVDKTGEAKVIRLGTPLVFISWVIRAIDKTFTAFVFADSFWNFGQRMVALPLNALTYRKAVEGKSSARAILFRELTLNLGTTIALLVLAVGVLIGGNLNLIFVLAPILGLLPLIAVYKHKL